MESPQHDPSSYYDLLTIEPEHPPVLIKPPPVYAGFWKRAGALVVDMTLVYSLMIVSFYAVAPGVSALESRITIPELLEGQFLEFITTFLFLICHWLYYALLESSRLQATPGKLLLRIRVTDLQGRPVTFVRASFRNLGKLLSEFTYWIGFLMAGFSPRRQALHDYLAGCVVVKGAFSRMSRFSKR
ncbi:MAG: RDD family protein [Candidatus Latescibacterota bacterium]